MPRARPFRTIGNVKLCCCGITGSDSFRRRRSRGGAELQLPPRLTRPGGRPELRPGLRARRSARGVRAPAGGSGRPSGTRGGRLRESGELTYAPCSGSVSDEAGRDWDSSLADMLVKFRLDTVRPVVGNAGVVEDVAVSSASSYVP